jgi:hypothetical protein
MPEGNHLQLVAVTAATAGGASRIRLLAVADAIVIKTYAVGETESKRGRERASRTPPRDRATALMEFAAKSVLTLKLRRHFERQGLRNRRRTAFE